MHYAARSAAGWLTTGLGEVIGDGGPNNPAADHPNAFGGSIRGGVTRRQRRARSSEGQERAAGEGGGGH